jgi:hypothetical protein
MRPFGDFAIQSRRGHDAILLALPILIIFIFVMAVGFAVFYVSGEDGIYLWDYHNYCDKYKELGFSLMHGDVRNVVWMIGNILKSWYNVTPVILLQPFFLLFNESRSGYIAAIVVFYLIPTAFISAYLGSLIGHIGRTTLVQSKRLQSFIILLMLAITYPPYWIPSLRGYPDIAGLIPLGLATIIVLRSDSSRDLSIQRAAALGFLLWVPFLFRKWYAYAIVAFYISAFFYSIVTSGGLNGGRLGRLKCITATYATAASSTLAFALLFQPLLVLEGLQTDLQDILQSYQISGIEHIESFINFFGPVNLLVASIGLAVGIDNRASRPVTLFVFLNLSILYVLFTHTQYFGPHHYLPVAFWIFSLDAVAICFFIKKISNAAEACVAAFLVSLLIFWGTFFPLPGWARQSVGWLLPQAKHYQLKFPNRRDYDALVADVERLTAGGDKLTVFDYGYDGYDDVMSDELLSALIGQQSNKWLVRTAHIDKRDKFQIEPLLARYAIVPDPLNTANLEHPALPPLPISMKARAVILEQVQVAPGQRIREGRGIGAAYRRLPTNYKISSNAVVHIFEKVRPFTLAEIDELLEHFFHTYPEWRTNYNFARVLLASDLNLIDRPWKIQFILPDELRIWPGKALSTRMSLPYSIVKAGHIKAFLVSTKHKWSECSEQESLAVTFEIGSTLIWQGEASPSDSVVPLTGRDGDVVSFKVGPAAQAGCEYLSVRPIFAKR